MQKIQINNNVEIVFIKTCKNLNVVLANRKILLIRSAPVIN